MTLNVELIVAQLGAIVGIILAAALGFHFWRKQKREEGLYLQDQTYYESHLAAAKAVWGLIVYFSENDNDKNMLKRGEKEENDQKIHYFRAPQAKMFFEQLNVVFYEQGHGVFLNKEIKSLLFELRSQAYAWYHIANKEESKELKITNIKKYNRVVEIREALSVELKKALLVKREWHR
ncbi:MAG: hypothetical protein EOM31_02985 [Bacteroidia bacterium]|nr:hypothetical protein [Bacteroidia bacterium]